MTWKPDEGLIAKLEAYWKSIEHEIEQDEELKESGIFSLAKPTTVGELADSLRGDGCDDIAQHLEDNYQRTEYLKPSSSITEAINDIRKGTPYGVLNYIVVGGHFHCCGPGAHEHE